MRAGPARRSRPLLAPNPDLFCRSAGQLAANFPAALPIRCPHECPAYVRGGGVASRTGPLFPLLSARRNGSTSLLFASPRLTSLAPTAWKNEHV
jgi:hypothetical protein